MRAVRMLVAGVLVAGLTSAYALQADEATRKLGAFLGKWKSEGTLAGGEKVLSNVECRWSPQGAFLVCEQTIQRSGGEARQLTTYSYSAKDNNYAYVTIANPGARPTSGTMEIQGKVWTYNFSYEANGKSVQTHISNDFTEPGTEKFKVETSDDGGAHWKTVLEGKATKVGE